MQRFRGLQVQTEQKYQEKEYFSGLFLTLSIYLHFFNVLCRETKKCSLGLHTPLSSITWLLPELSKQKVKFRAQELYLLALTLSFPHRPRKRTWEILTSQSLWVSRPLTGPCFTGDQKCSRTCWNTPTKQCVFPADQVLDAFKCTNDEVHFQHFGKLPKGVLLLPFCRAQVMLQAQD